MDVLQCLKLEMPLDVLEQFVFDHGTSELFQEQYGSLDLHAVVWEKLEMPAFEIISCSVYPHFIDRVYTVSERTRIVTAVGWDDVNLPSAAVEHWQTNQTWLRPPIFLCGDLVDSDQPLHLVEGHTRTGALKGLVDSHALDSKSMHQVWYGQKSQPIEDNHRWREVLRTDHISFLSWFMKLIGENGEIGVVASRLIEIQFNSINPLRIQGDDLEAILSYAKQDEVLKSMMSTIQAAHDTWKQYVGM